eukprot:g8087.t1
MAAAQATQQMSEAEVLEWLAPFPKLSAQLEAIRIALQRRERHALGSFRAAKLTAELFRNVVGSCRWSSTGMLLIRVKAIGRLLAATQPRNLAIGNITRRILHIIRDEHARHVAEHPPAPPPGADPAPSLPSAKPAGGDAEPAADLAIPKMNRSLSCDFSTMRSPSLQHLMTPAVPTVSEEAAGNGDAPAVEEKAMAAAADADESARAAVGAGTGTGTAAGAGAGEGGEMAGDNVASKQLRTALLESVGELMAELENVLPPVAEQALEHIHANEVILTYGCSRIVEEFLKEANRKRRDFSVVVAESAPRYSGHTLAKSLSEAKIDTTLIHDAAVFAIMARVNKVVIPAHAVLANGGVIARAGAHLIACAAREHAVPVVCLAGLFKLSPLYAHDQDTFNELGAPTEVMAFERGDETAGSDVLAQGCRDGDSDGDGDGGSGAGSSSALGAGVGDDAAAGPGAPSVGVVNPGYDYVDPSFVDLHITNIGG